MLIDVTSKDSSLRAILEHIQASAWERMGVRESELEARFERRRQAYRDLAAINADYQDFRWGLDDQVVLKHGLPSSVEGLWVVKPPTAYQDPAVYAWLELVWRYIGIELPFESDFVGAVILASAPTGSFNAIAVPSKQGGAIIVEEGLVMLARRLCKLLSPLLYVARSEALTIRTKRELEAHLDADQDGPLAIAQLFMDYITEGGVDLPAVPGTSLPRTPEARFADTLFQSFIAFVLWHELLHLEVACGNPGVMNAGALARDGVEMATALKAIAESAGLDFDRAQVLEAFARQREESEADTYAMIRAATYGTRTNTLPGTVTGAMAFMFALETVHRMIVQINNLELYGFEACSSLTQLRASALLGDRDHPHPRVRRDEVINVITQLNFGVGQMVGFEAERLDQVFQFVWRYLDATITVSADDVQRLANRWLEPDAEAVRAMKRGLSSP